MSEITSPRFRLMRFQAAGDLVRVIIEPSHRLLNAPAQLGRTVAEPPGRLTPCRPKPSPDGDLANSYHATDTLPERRAAEWRATKITACRWARRDFAECAGTAMHGLLLCRAECRVRAIAAVRRRRLAHQICAFASWERDHVANGGLTASSITRRSSPRAMPPCGGAP